MTIYEKPKVDEVTLRGASEQTYPFNVYPWGTSFKPLGAVYTVLRLEGSKYTILYIGQTNNLSERFDNHHRKVCFDRNGKTHIGIHQEASEKQRFYKETDMVRNYSPTCNK
ncbi:MAG: GIY-YIG nuclease family protein [Porticoccaceae bacterium]